MNLDAELKQCVIMLAIIVGGMIAVFAAAAFTSGCGGEPFSASLAESAPDAVPAGEGGSSPLLADAGSDSEDAPTGEEVQADTWVAAPDTWSAADSWAPPPETGPACTPLPADDGTVGCGGNTYTTPGYICMNGNGVPTPGACSCVETFNCDCIMRALGCSGASRCTPANASFGVDCR